jgi:cytochrome c-type biogenesis protein CcmF
VFVGTLYPLALEALTGERISVGAPFFNLTFAPIMVPLLVIVPFGPMLAWKRGDIRAAAERLVFAFGAALAAAIVAAALAGAKSAMALFGIGLGVWLIAGALSELAYRARVGSVAAGESVKRVAGLPRSTFGTTLAHAGVGITLIGIVSASTWSTEDILTMKPGETTTIAGRAITFDGFVPGNGPNYRETSVRLTVRKGGAVESVLQPSKREFAARQMTTTEAAIGTFGFSQLYVSLGDIGADGATTVRIYWKPFVTLIWLGAIVMALGGLVSLSDRRLRVGAPRPARRAIAAPAE